MEAPRNLFSRNKAAAIISFIYAVFGGLWILFSDRVALMIADGPESYSRIQTAKGWIYVAVTAVLVFVLIRMYLNMIHAVELRSRKALQHALDQRTRELNRTHNQLIETRVTTHLLDLMVGLAHEMNTPLGNAKTISSMMAEETSRLLAPDSRETEKYRQMHQLLAESLDRALRLMDAFRSFSPQLWNLHPVQAELSSLTRQLLETWAAQKDPGPGPLRLKLDIEASLEARLDPEIWTMILAQLWENSLAHGRSGQEDFQISVGLIREESDIVLRFSDNGRGIEDDHLPRLAEPFFTTRRHEGRPGLGLSVAYRLATQILMGSMNWENLPKGGCRFTIRIPEWHQDRVHHGDKLPSA